MNPRPHTFQAKAAVVIVDRAPGRELMGQHAPGAACPAEVQDSVDDLTHVNLTRATARLGRRDPGFYELPLLIRQVTGIRYPFHILAIGRKTSKRPLFTHTLRSCALV